MDESTISLSGVFPPISTPFDAQGEIATRALAENLERWNQHDLVGYVVLGSNGERESCCKPNSAYLDGE